MKVSELEEKYINLCKYPEKLWVTDAWQGCIFSSGEDLNDPLDRLIPYPTLAILIQCFSEIFGDTELHYIDPIFSNSNDQLKVIAVSDVRIIDSINQESTALYIIGGSKKWAIAAGDCDWLVFCCEGSYFNQVTERFGGTETINKAYWSNRRPIETWGNKDQHTKFIANNATKNP